MADNATTTNAHGVYTRRQRFEILRGQMTLERSSFIPTWKELNDYILPRRGRFMVTDTNKGERRTQKILDSTATFSARTLSSGMMGGVSSPARPWFKLGIADPDTAEIPAVQDWLYRTTQRMHSVLVKSNTYNVLPMVYSDLGVFGTSAMMVEEDDEDIIRCYQFPIGTYLISNDHKLRVRTFIREFRMKVDQLVKRFGIDQVSTSTKADWEAGRRESWVDVVYVICPNDIYDPSKLESKHKPFAGCYYEAAMQGRSGGDGLLEEKGFDEFPLFAPRWSLTGEDDYGTDSPGITVLGDVKQLQTGEKRALQAIEKMINPPMVGSGELKTSSPSIIAGGITYLDEPGGTLKFRPAHEVNFNIEQLEQKQNACRSRIQRGMYEDLFLMLAYSDPQRGSQPITAREVEERHEEKLLVLGPVLEQLNQDLFDPFIDRVFNIMLRKGLIPEPPAEIEGMDLKVEYISIMAQAQKAVGLAGVDRFLGVVGAMATYDPSALDKVDRDEVIAEYASMTGVPPKFIVSDERVAEVRGARAQAQQAKETAENANVAASAAQRLSKTDTRQPSALTDVMDAARTVGAAA